MGRLHFRLVGLPGCQSQRRQAYNLDTVLQRSGPIYFAGPLTLKTSLFKMSYKIHGPCEVSGLSMKIWNRG